MSKTRKKIVEAIQSIGAPMEDAVMSGYVKAVDEAKATMSVVLNVNGQVLEGVMLHALGGSLKGLVVIPEADSDVVICSVDGSGEYMLVQADKIKKVLLDIDSMQAKVSGKVEINCDNIVFNGGENGGMVKVGRVIEKLNFIEEDLNKVKHVFNMWQPVYENSLKTGLTTWIAQQLQETNINDLEDTKVKH